MPPVTIAHRAPGAGKIWQQILTTALHGDDYYIIVPFLQMRNPRLRKEPSKGHCLSAVREPL